VFYLLHDHVTSAHKKRKLQKLMKSEKGRILIGEYVAIGAIRLAAKVRAPLNLKRREQIKSGP
jgi:hypothetical protein